MSIKIALAGNPNCGKTTLFNALTGSNQFVGNWPGVTVEKKEGGLKGEKDVEIIDLPGIYSLSPYTLEEVIARNYLLNERPDAIINIVDGTNLERNLYLSTQLMELGIPVLMAVNMADIMEKQGDKVDLDRLSERLGCEVVSISALRGTGIWEAARRAVALAQVRDSRESIHSFAPAVEAIIERVQGKLKLFVPKEQQRFFAIKLLEKDDKIAGQLSQDIDVSFEIRELEAEMDDDIESIITNERYVYISGLMGECVTKKKTEKMTISDKIDRIVTNRFAALPIFALIMFFVYYISMVSIGTMVTDWTNDGVFGDGWHLLGIGAKEYETKITDYARETIFTEEVKAMVSEAKKADAVGAGDVLDSMEKEDFGEFNEAYGTYGDVLAQEGFDISAIVEPALEEAPDTADYGIWVPSIPTIVENGLNAIHCAEWLTGLILNGIVGGVGAVLGFVPQMLILFIFLAFLEACGYMARVAFIMDRIFCKFGLSGKSFIPMLIGTGCGVPGVMASRTIENDRDRKMTIITTTFIPCGAKMPIVALIAAALFHNTWWVAPSAYFVGIAAVICSGIILKKTKIFAGDPAPFVMELPAYHLPTAGNVLRSMWERGWSFIKKAGTIILLSSIIIWAGSCFGVVNGKLLFDAEMELETSLLGILGNAVCFIFAPLGFDNIRATIATIMGLVAKEEVVGVFGVLDFEGMSRIAAYSFLVFNLLCAPCFAAMGAIKREMNHIKWFWFAIGYQTAFAYAVALCVFQIGSFVSTGAFGVGTVTAFLVIIVFIYMLVRPYKKSKTFQVNRNKLVNVK